ncbi:MAG: hypothetical protein MJZ40_01440 [Bacteroidaceae bacterium]|nr:hypothetical protein [Bacteroidaceae bacterium]
MKKTTAIIKSLCLILALAALSSMESLAANYYSQVTAYAYMHGEVLVTSTADAKGIYNDNSTCSQVSTKTKHTYYLKARKYDGYLFDGWYSDEACTQLIATTPNYTYTVTSSSQDESNPTEAEVYALFCEDNGYQVRNGGFERWFGNEPAPGWDSFPPAVGTVADLGKRMSPNPEKVEGRNGGSAVRLFSKFAGIGGAGANANGNLTTGRVNMGSMTPTDKSNHNFSDLANEGYFLTIAGQPDGVEFYSKYKMGDGEEHQGHAQFIIHDAVNYVDPQREDQKEHRIGQAETFIAESKDWERQTAEFHYDWDKDKAAATLKYLLINFTTNNTPGGSKGDELILDDVRLIYNSELTGAKYNGQNITFIEGQATVNANYDATLLTDLTSNGRGASIETSYNNETSVLTITVMGEDYNFNIYNKHEYTVQFGSENENETELFEIVDNGNGTVTVTPADLNMTYYYTVTSDELNAAFDKDNDDEFFANAIDNILFPDLEVHTDVQTVVLQDLWNEVTWGAIDYTAGEYRFIVGEVKEQDGLYVQVGQPTVYTYSVGQTTGIGTVLRPEATKAIYNLQGQRLQRQQRGINLVGSKKVVR